MRRVFQSAVLAAVFAAATITPAGAVGQATANTNKQATLVMTNGDRHSGTLVYKNDSNVNLLENGQEKPYPMDQIAVVDFGGGDPSAAELNQLPTGDASNDVNRHMLTLRDGTVVHGRMYTITPGAITMNTQNGHQDFDLNNVTRWYVNPGGARQVYASVLASAPASGSTVGTTGQASKPGGAIQVNANQPWTDTGITVRRGDRIAFSTTGQVAIRQGTTATLGPDGDPNESRAGAPVQSVGVGALIGRIGTGAPFAIGANSQPITMPSAGRLYLGVNDAGTSDNSGSFVVTIVR